MIFPIFSYTFQIEAETCVSASKSFMRFFMSNSIGLYIHIPFCKHKCPYCDFFSGNADDAFDNYVIELKDKIKYCLKKPKEILQPYISAAVRRVFWVQTDFVIFLILSSLILIFKIMPRLRLKSIPTPPKLLILKKCMPADLIAFQWVCRLLLKMN